MIITTVPPDKRRFEHKYTDNVEPMSTQPVTMVLSSSAPSRRKSKRFSLNRMFSKRELNDLSQQSISVPMDPVKIDDCFKRDDKVIQDEVQKEKARQELLFLLGEGNIIKDDKQKHKSEEQAENKDQVSRRLSKTSMMSRRSSTSTVSARIPNSSRRSSTVSASSIRSSHSYYFSGIPLVRLTTMDGPYRRKYDYGCKTVEDKKAVQQICVTPDLEYLPLIVFRCIQEISKHLTQVGLYKVEASAQTVEHLRRSFTDSGPLCDLSEYCVHTFACFLKGFLRQLPDDLFPVVRLYHEPHTKVLVSVLKHELATLSKQAIVVLRTLCIHIQDVSNHHETNKMTLSSLAQILGPCLRVSPAVVEMLVKNTPEIWCGMEGNGVYSYEPIEVVKPTYPPGLFPSRIYSHENVSEESFDEQINGVVYCGDDSPTNRQIKCTSMASTVSQVEPQSPPSASSEMDDSVTIVGLSEEYFQKPMENDIKL